MKRYILLCCSLLPIAISSATYYKKTRKFHQAFTVRSFEKADAILEKDKRKTKGRNRLLYFFNSGTVNYMLGQHEQSIQRFMDAERYIEDYQKNYGKELLTLISNPSVKPYAPESFESIMVNFYMALNFLQTGQYNSAIVESKRINIKLNILNDKYKDRKKKYQKDAFAHTLMGLIYDANGDYNNAFIAYRNAYDVYETDYAKYFSMTAPEQLKKDLLRAAYRTGFLDEVATYEKKFDMKYNHKVHEGGEVIFFWLNGLGPIKSQSSINFTTVKGRSGYVTFVNEELGITFPYFIGNKPNNEQSALSSLRVMRVAFPKYQTRKSVYNQASLTANGQKYPLETAEDLNAIAFKSLRDRMFREVGNSLLRLATKKALEQQARQQNQSLGSLVSIVNAITEKADTRNWQTLPSTIAYTRMLLPEGKHDLELEMKGTDDKTDMASFQLNIKKGQTTFKTYHSLEAYPIPEKEHYY